MLSDLARGKEGDDGELEIYLDLGKSAKNVVSGKFTRSIEVSKDRTRFFNEDIPTSKETAFRYRSITNRRLRCKNEEVHRSPVYHEVTIERIPSTLTTRAGYLSLYIPPLILRKDVKLTRVNKSLIEKAYNISKDPKDDFNFKIKKLAEVVDQYVPSRVRSISEVDNQMYISYEKTTMKYKTWNCT